MTTVINTLKSNGSKTYEYVGCRYGSDGFTATGLEFSETIESAGADYGQEENEGNDSRIVVDGEIQFIEAE